MNKKIITSTLAIAFLFFSADADAKKRRKKRTKKPVAAAPAPTPKMDTNSTKSVEDLLTEAQREYQQLEYDRVIPLAKAVIGREGVPVEKKLDAYLLQGSALAIVGDPIDAETPFRLLLEYRPDFDMPAETPPKIMAVFSKVKIEVDEFQKAKRRMLRKKILAGLSLKGENPTEGEGGLPLVFNYGLKDPTGAVDTLSVQYRRKGDKNFSVLALKRSDDGRWKGAIPPDLTANEGGLDIEYFVETRDANGPLLTRGSSSKALTAKISEGSADRAGPPPLPVWAFTLAATGSGALTAVWAAAGTAVTVAQVDYLRLRSSSDPIDGADLVQKEQVGWILAGITSGTAVAAVIGWGVTGGMAFFTNWSGEEEVEY